jgi:hypothetical protein
LGGSFSRDARNSLSNDLAGAIGQNSIKRDTGRLFEIAYGQTDTDGAIKDVRAVFDQIAEFAPALKDLDINASNVSGLGDILIKTFQNVAKSGQVLAKALEKVPSANRLGTGAFLSRPNLDAYGQAALTGRSPLANRGQRAQSRFDFFTELSGAGGIGKELLEGNPTYGKAKAGVQANNVGDILIRFLKDNNPNTGSLRDSNGNPNFTGIERTLELVAKSGTANSELAKVLLPLVGQVKSTLADAKVNAVGFTEGVSGFTPGADYGAFAKSRKRGGSGYITSKDGRNNIPASDTDFINSANVKSNIPAQKAFDLVKEAAAATEQAVDKIVKNPIQVNVNIQGTLNMIEKGMDAGLAVAIDSAVSSTVKSYLAQMNPQLAQYNARISMLEGKPIPPDPMKSVRRIFGMADPNALPVVGGLRATGPVQ